MQAKVVEQSLATPKKRPRQEGADLEQFVLGPMSMFQGLDQLSTLSIKVCPLHALAQCGSKQWNQELIEVDGSWRPTGGLTHIGKEFELMNCSSL